MDLISRNSNDRSINLKDPKIIALETSHKYHLHLEKAIKNDYLDDLMKSIEKYIKDLTT